MPELDAIRLYSAVLGAEVWLVHRNLPRAEWPTDAVCYTGAEAEVLPAVHLVKEVFGASVQSAKKPGIVLDEQDRQQGPTRERCALARGLGVAEEMGHMRAHIP